MSARKSSFHTNLDQISVFLTDNDPISRYFRVTQLNETLTGGKNAFLIQGSQRLRENTYIYIEIKDSNGNVIYNEPASGLGGDYYEGLSIPVSVHVYDDTTFGPATVTIVGELKEYEDNGIIRPIPSQWIGKINVRWQRTVTVDPFKANTTPIRFYRRPIVAIEEVLLPVYNRFSTIKKYTGSFRANAIDPVENTDWPYNKPITYEITSINPKSASFTNPLSTYNKNATPLKAQSLNTILTAKNILLKDAPTTQSFATPSNWNATIKNIISPYRAIVDIPYISQRTNIESTKIKNIELGEFELTYESSSVELSEIVSSSYATIKLDNLETFSGDVHRVKIFAKSRNDLGGFTLLDDVVLENRELLKVNFFKGELDRSIGVFDDSEIYDKYWATSSLTVPPPAGAWTPQIEIEVPSNTYLLNAIRYECQVDYENREDIPGVGILYNSQSIEFIKDYEYKLTFNAVFTGGSYLFNDISLGSWGDPVEEIVSRGYIDVYVSGSALDEDGQVILNSNGNPLPTFDSSNSFNVGKKIASLRANIFKRFDNLSYTFKADRNGDGRVLFYIKSGIWEINDISIKPAAETAFNPGEIKIITKPNIQIPNEQFDFRFEFFDINYTAVPLILERVIRFGGGNDILPSILFINSTPDGGQVPPNQFIGNERVLGKFLISTNSLSAFPKSLRFRVDTNRVFAPFDFRSSSLDLEQSAFDKAGNRIFPTDVLPEYRYPGDIDIEGTVLTNTFGPNLFNFDIDYADFTTSLQNDNTGLFRLVDRITYRVYDEAGKLEDANNPGQLTIIADWSQFKDCPPAIIDPTSIRLTYGQEPNESSITEFTPSTKDVISFEASNFPGIFSNRPWDEWIVWWSTSETNDWYYGYTPLNHHDAYREFTMGGGYVFNGGSTCIGSICGYSWVPGKTQRIKFPDTELLISGNVQFNDNGRDVRDVLPDKVEYRYWDNNISNYRTELATQSLWNNSVEHFTPYWPNALWNDLPYNGSQGIVERLYQNTSTPLGPTEIIPEEEDEGYNKGYLSTYNQSNGKTAIKIYLPDGVIDDASYLDLRISKRCHRFLYIDNSDKTTDNPLMVRYEITPRLYWTMIDRAYLTPQPFDFVDYIQLQSSQEDSPYIDTGFYYQDQSDRNPAAYFGSPKPIGASRLTGASGQNFKFKSGYVVAVIDTDVNDAFKIDNDIYTNDQLTYPYSEWNPLKLLGLIPNTYDSLPAFAKTLYEELTIPNLANTLNNTITPQFQSKFPGKKIAVVPFLGKSFDVDFGFKVKRNLVQSDLIPTGPGLSGYTRASVKLYAYSASVQSADTLPEVTNTRTNILPTNLTIRANILPPRFSITVYFRDPDSWITANGMHYFVWIRKSGGPVLSYDVFSVTDNWTGRGKNNSSEIGDPNYRISIDGFTADGFTPGDTYEVAILSANNVYQVTDYSRSTFHKTRVTTVWKDYELDYNGILKPGVDQAALLQANSHCVYSQTSPVRAVPGSSLLGGAVWTRLTAPENATTWPTTTKYPASCLQYYTFTANFGGQSIDIDIGTGGKYSGRGSIPGPVLAPQSMTPTYTPCLTL